MSPPGPEVCDAVRWLGAHTSADGVVERSFHLGTGGVVAGVVWLPSSPESACPVVAMGQGGSGHKRNGRNVDLGHWFASRAGIAAVAIDGPSHGERAATPLAAGESRNRMVGDWRAAVDAVRTLASVDATRLGYVGLRVAPGPYEDPTVMDHIGADARRVSAPTLLHVQWDDELFPRDGQFALFESLGSREKQLIAFPGSHRETAPTAPAMWCDFICRHIRPDDAGQAGAAVARP